MNFPPNALFQRYGGKRIFARPPWLPHTCTAAARLDKAERLLIGELLRQVFLPDAPLHGLCEGGRADVASLHVVFLARALLL